jgi:hypothetical protein
MKHRPFPLLRWLPFSILSVLLLISGCGSSDTETSSLNSTASPLTTLTVQHVLQRTLETDVVDLRMKVKDVNGALVQAEQDFRRAGVITLSVPQDSAVLEIEYLDSSQNLVGRFSTLIDPNQGPILIDRPAWVDAESIDPTIYRFAFVGCNRLGFGELSDGNPSSANVLQLLAILNGLPEVQPAVSHFFMAGDLVTNLDPGTQTLQTQLTAWLELLGTSALPASPIELVTFTGNHEVLVSRKDPDTGDFVEFPNPPTLPVWTSIMAAFIRGNDGPTTALPNMDQLTDDQSQLSYTFQDGNILFIILNTDTFVDDKILGDVPLNWLEERLDQATSNNTVDHVFVMGHKPVVSPPGAEEPAGAGSIRQEEKAAMAQLLGEHHKVRGYLCAHAHLWNYQVLDGGAPQVIAGNAGSQVEPPFDDTRRGYYGYTLYSLHTSGSVHLESWGRPIPTPYNSDLPQPEATLREMRLLEARP